MEKEPKYTRPEKLLEALGLDFKGLSEEERVMQKLLTEKYKKEEKSLVAEINEK